MDGVELSTLATAVLRHALTTAGGALVAHGVMSASSVEPFVGAAVTLIGVAFSFVQKYFAAKKAA